MSTEDDKWRFINSINNLKNDKLIDDPELEKDYNPFFINRSLSYHLDTLIHAFKMDKYSGLSKSHQYFYLLNKVKKAKRFTKFVRRSNTKSEPDDLRMVQEHFNYNIQKARSALSILSKEELNAIRYKKGGLKSDK